MGLRLVRFRMRRIVRAGQRRLLMLYGCLASAQMAHGSPDLPASAAKPCVSCLTVGLRYLHLPVAGSAAVRNDVGVLGCAPADNASCNLVLVGRPRGEARADRSLSQRQPELTNREMDRYIISHNVYYVRLWLARLARMLPLPWVRPVRWSLTNA